MQTLKLSAVQEKGQITIPAEIRRKWGLRKGDLVAFVETEAGVVISPQEVIAMESLDQIGKIAVPHNLLRDLTEQVFMAYYLQPTRGGVGHENPKRILPEKANCVHL